MTEATRSAHRPVPSSDEDRLDKAAPGSREASTNPDFIEALARGLDVIKAFGASHTSLSLSEVAAATGLSRPTARRMLITFAELGYIANRDGAFSLTPRVLELGLAYISSSNIWSLTRRHLEWLSSRTGQSCSIAQLDGGDVVYVARVSVPKLVALSVHVGTMLPAVQTSLGKVLLAALPQGGLDTILSTPSRSGIVPHAAFAADEIYGKLREVRARGWALTDQELAPAIRSVAAPIRNGDGQVVAAININCHALETDVRTMTETYLPLLLHAASEISHDWQLWSARPIGEAIGDV